MDQMPNMPPLDPQRPQMPMDGRQSEWPEGPQTPKRSPWREILATLSLPAAILAWLLGSSAGPFLAEAILLVAPALVLAIVALACRTTTKGRAIAAIIIAALLPIVAFLAPPHSREMASRALCKTNLKAIASAMVSYEQANDGAAASTLDAMLTTPQLLEKHLQCPTVELRTQPTALGDKPDYFYMPPPKDAPGGALVACDYVGNHDDVRNCLFADRSIKQLGLPKFAEVLSEPQNAAFAAALREAEEKRAAEEEKK